MRPLQLQPPPAQRLAAAAAAAAAWARLRSAALLAAGAVALALAASAYLRAREEAAVEAAAAAAEEEPAAAPPQHAGARADVLAAVPSPAEAEALLLCAHPSELYVMDRGVLGEGGFGAVCQGAARASGERCAIKRFKGSLSALEEGALEAALRVRSIDPLSQHAARARARVLRMRQRVAEQTRSYALHEVRALLAVKGLRSPSFIDMLSAHAAGGAYYIVTALAGGTADHAVAALPLRERLTVLHRAAGALAHLHAAGCAHRDIKPDNLATRREEPLQPVLLDLGLLLLPAPHADAIGASTGCTPFLPPEALQDGAASPALTPLQLAQARDVFSLGCTMTMLLYGAALPPTSWAHAYAMHTADTAATATSATSLTATTSRSYRRFMQQRWQEPLIGDTLAHLGASPGHLKALLAAMLARDPAQRPSMAHVAAHPAFAITGQGVGGGAAAVAEAAAAEAAGLPDGRPATPLPPAALRALPFDHHDNVHAHWQRNLARNTRLALMRDVVRVQFEHELDAAQQQRRQRWEHQQQQQQRQDPEQQQQQEQQAALELLPRLQAALAGVHSVSRGAEFDAMLHSAGLTPALLPFDHGELFTLLDKDECGSVDKRTLLAGLAFLLAARLPLEAEAQMLFQAFDVEGRGSLSRAAVREMLAAYGVPRLSHSLAEVLEEGERVEELFDRLDVDHDGGVTLAELLQGMRQQGLLRSALSGKFFEAEEDAGGWWGWARRLLKITR